MADQRGPLGRRPPVLPLPAPPRDDEDTRAGHVYRPVGQDLTGDLPRLPEVERIDESREVELQDDQHWTAAGNPNEWSAARSVPVPPPPVVPPPRSRSAPPVQAAGKVKPPRIPSTPMPMAPPRSGGVRVETAEHSSLIGGRYRIVNRIGQGGMGKVYKVNHTHLSRTFALKIISNTVAETDEARELFYREARFASAMSHPGITAVVDFGEDERVGMFMVMEFVAGEPLNRILFREKQLNVRMATDIVQQVAEALHYIHQNNVVHCDIKTENILITDGDENGRRKMVAKLLDFGLARSLTASRASTSLSGTPHYVAPERIRGEPASPSSDVYGVGILLYELVTGQVPWDGPVQKILSGHLDEVPRSPSTLVEGGVDPALENLIMHALAKRPAERHKDMAAFLYELRTVNDMLGFGSRRKGGPTKRVVIEQRAENRRDELGRITFDACRLPLALLTPDGTILAANPAFAKFVMGVSVEVEGLPIKSTPLAGAWSTAEVDLQRTLLGKPVRRIIEIDVAGGGVRRLLLWLDAVSSEQVVLGVQPLEAEPR